MVDPASVTSCSASKASHPLWDGWLLDGFFPLDRLMTAYNHGSHYSRGWGDLWRGLVEADGDVTIRGSQVLAPGNLSRKANREFHKEEVDPEEALSVTQIACHGGHISVDGAKLEVTDSRIEYVPILSNRSTVQLAGASVLADGDAVSLVEPQGSIVDSTIVAKPPRHGVPFEGHDDRYLWAIAVEGASSEGPLEVRDTVFEGFEMGVDLSHALVDLEGCEFRSIEQMALWDHASSGLGGWEEIRSRNAFVGCANNKYLRTDLTVIEFTHDEIPEDEIEIWSGSPLRFGLDLYVPIQGSLEFFSGNTARFMVPRVLVTLYDRVQESEELSWSLTWEGAREVITWDPGEESLQFNLSELFDDTPEPWGSVRAPMTVDAVHPLDDVGPRSFSFDIDIYASDLNALDVRLDIELDGVLDHTVDLDEAIALGKRYIEVTYNRTYSPGEHALDLIVRGRPITEEGDYSEVVEEIDNLSQSFVLLAEDDDIEPWPSLGVDYVLMERGAEIDLGDIPNEAAEPSLRLRLVGGNGTRVAIGCSDLSTEDELNVVIFGDLSLHLANGSLYQLAISDVEFHVSSWMGTGYKGSSIVIENITCTHLVSSSSGRDTHVLDSNVDGRLYVAAWFCQEVSLTNTTLSGRGANIDVYNTTLSIRNCSFASLHHWGVKVQTFGASFVEVDNCTFEGAYLMMDQSSYSYFERLDLNVTRCTFSGPDAILYVGWELSSMDSYDQEPSWTPDVSGAIEGNTFGGGSDIVLHHGLCKRLLGENALEAGSKVRAMFITRLQVIPPETTPVNHGFHVIETEGVVANWPYDIWRWFAMDGEVLLDVTDDPDVELDPPSTPVLLLSLGHHNMVVRGFATIELDEDNDEATFPLVPDLDSLLEGLVEGWPWR